MDRHLTLGYSPCPNDTYVFYALVHGKVAVPGITVRERLEDVETLNQLALVGTLDLTKVSYLALGHLRDRYALLRSGGALGGAPSRAPETRAAGGLDPPPRRRENPR